MHIKKDFSFFLFSYSSEPKAPDGLGVADMAFLGHSDMWPFQYSQVLKDKPKKMNKKEDKEFEDDHYIPFYTFALPAEV